MCGIAGIVNRGSTAPVQASELERLRDLQSHRGPDDAGIWLSPDQRIGLAHRRLSIIDLSSRGHQPMQSDNGRFCITYNGEIYNHRGLRKELEGKGFRFLSDSDTEVILHGYREWGSEVVQRLRGMFAFAIWDTERQEIFLARDPLGIKPLFYSDAGGRTSFASEPRALVSSLNRVDLDAQGIASFLLWGSIPSPHSLYANIRSLEPGSWLRISLAGKREEQTYWHIEDAFATQDRIADVDPDAALTAALRDSVRHHLVSDVPVGAFLSGGVDSAALVGLLAEMRPGSIETITLGFDDPELDESELARTAANLYGTRHHEIRLRLEDVRDRIPAAIEAMVQPTIDGINTYFVSEAAVAAGLKVAVSGIGGDELFGGYDSFRWIPRILRFHSRMRVFPGLAPAARRIARGCEGLDVSRSLARASRLLAHGATPFGAYFSTRGLFSPTEIGQLIDREFFDDLTKIDPCRWLESRVDLSRIREGDWVSALELRQYMQSQLLRDTDVASMAHSLEVRTPLVDRDLLTAVARVPAEARFAGRAKRALRNAPAHPLPASLWNRKKKGFTLPFDQWIRSGKLDLTLPDHPAFDQKALQRVRIGFESGRVHWSRYWALLVLGQYLRSI